MKMLILRGDGIGPEITEATCEVLSAINTRLNVGLDLQLRDIGFASLATSKSTLPDALMDEIRETEAILLGPIDNFSYPPESEGGRNPSMMLRKGLDLYANIRPAKSRPGVRSRFENIDLVVVRENTEGFYTDRNMFEGGGEFMPTPDVALAIRKITAKGSRRIARQAFDLARKRRKKVSAIHKGNVFKLTDGLFLREVRSVAEEFPDVELEELLFDAAAAHLIRRAEDFDVILATNLFGDTLSDQTAEMSGGLGLGPSINVGDHNAIAQAAHGSAPDIAGLNIANPTAMILSVKMQFDHLAIRKGLPLLAHFANLIEHAVETTLADPATQTKDLGGTLGTKEFGQVVARLASTEVLDTVSI